MTNDISQEEGSTRVRELESDVERLTKSVRTLRNVVVLMGLGLVAALVLSVMYTPSTFAVDKIELNGADGNTMGHINSDGLFFSDGKRKASLTVDSLGIWRDTTSSNADDVAGLFLSDAHFRLGGPSGDYVSMKPGDVSAQKGNAWGQLKLDK